MKLTQQVLKQIIKEEIEAVLQESNYSSIEDYINARGPLEKGSSAMSAFVDMQAELVDALDAVGFTDHLGNKDRKLLVQWLSATGVPEKEIKAYISKMIKQEKEKARIAALENKLVYHVKKEIEDQRKKGMKSGMYAEFRGDQIDFYIGSLAYDEDYSDEEVKEAVSILSKEMPNINFIYEI